jgi:hypothetical protein
MQKTFRVTDQRLFMVKLKLQMPINQFQRRTDARKTSRIIDISQNQTYFNSSQTNCVGFE